MEPGAEPRLASSEQQYTARVTQGVRGSLVGGGHLACGRQQVLKQGLQMKKGHMRADSATQCACDSTQPFAP